MNRYNSLSDYYKELFGERLLKICIDGGFTCPNRDGKCGTGGCIFCGADGSGEHLPHHKSIHEQVLAGLELKKDRANKFIVYFQDYTNTYDTIENLKMKYNEALIDDRIIGLSIATRPDCINEDIARLLASYSPKYFVTIELGLQTSSDKTAKLINRGYDSKVFTEAVEILTKYNLNIVCHIMLGLPGETKEDLENTINFVNSHPISGVKIHSTYIIKNTMLEKMYNQGEYTPLTLDEYIKLACFTIAHLRRDLIIHRISGDAPKNILVAPEWNLHKKWILNGITKYLKEFDIFQGEFYFLTFGA